MKSKLTLKEAGASVIMALACAFAACNQNDQIIAPEKNDLKLGFHSEVAASSSPDLAKICQREKSEVGTSTALIGPAGGVLKRAKHQLVIPPGALSKSVKISFSMLASAYLECELKPYGLKFNTPVSLVLSYNGACDANLDELALKVAYYNPQTQLGVLIPKTIDTELNVVTVEIERFALSASGGSRYGLIRR
jgi:hypothetical protein